MKPRSIGSLGILMIAIFLGQACAPPQTYYWGKYEPALYSLTKNPKDIDKYIAQLQELIQKAENRNQVPPGVYAEYGYALMITNRGAEAVSYFQKEKAKWPESAALMDRMINSASSPKKTEPLTQATPATQSNPAIIAPEEKKQ